MKTVKVTFAWFLFLCVSIGDHTTVNATERDYCLSDICPDQSRLFCPRSKVILITDVTCQRGQGCPSFVYRNVVKYCWLVNACERAQILVTSALCASYQSVVVTYTCVDDPLSTVKTTCSPARIAESNGFIGRRLPDGMLPRRFTRKPTDGECRWSTSIPRGQVMTMLVYDLYTESSFRANAPTLVVKTSNHESGCGPASREGVTMTTRLPHVITVTGGNYVTIEMDRKNRSESRMLAYYHIEKIDSGRNMRVLHPSMTSSCTSSRDGGTNWRARIFDLFDRTTPRTLDKTPSPARRSQASTTTTIPLPILEPHSAASNEAVWQQRDTYILLMGLGIGVVVCGLVVVIRYCWKAGSCRRGHEKKVQQKHTRKSLDMTRCTPHDFTMELQRSNRSVSNDRPQDSPVYASIDDHVTRRSLPITVDPYCDVVDKLANPAPPPRRLFSVARSKLGSDSTSSGHIYTEITHDFPFMPFGAFSDKQFSPNSPDSSRLGRDFDMRFSARYAQQTGGVGRKRVSRCMSDSSGHPTSVYIFPNTITNCYI